MNIDRIICLEKGTCSFRAARHLKEILLDKKMVAPEILPRHRSFYGAIDWMRKNAISGDLTLLPDVHGLTPHIKIDPDFEWIAEYSFKLENPPIYLAKSATAFPDNSNKCATIRALRRLVTERSELIPHDFLDVENTQQAAKIAKQGGCGYCITNEEGLRRYDLEIVQNLRHLTPYWEAFRRI